MTPKTDANGCRAQLFPGPPGFVGTTLSIGGHLVGDPELYGTAGQLAEGLARFRSRRFERVSPTFFREPTQYCLETVRDALFGPRDSLEDCLSSIREYGAFLLSPNLCESLDAYLVVVVSDGSHQRILARNHAGGAVLEVTVPDGTLEGEFEAAEETLLRLPGYRSE